MRQVLAQSLGNHGEDFHEGNLDLAGPLPRNHSFVANLESAQGLAASSIFMDLKSLIVRARAEHACSPGATSDEIAIAENRIGYSFTDDLRELLRECNGIQFWTTGNFPCRLLPAGEIKPVHLFLDGDEGPRGLVALVESQGDFVAMGLDRESRCYSRLVDCSHETFPYELFGVCDSLQDMLALILDSKDQEWIWPAARASSVDFADR